MSTSKKLRRRDFGRSSPLDLLPRAAQAQLVRRCESTATYRQIAAWLRETHGCQTSPTALCGWWHRRRAEGGGTRVTLPRAGLRVRIVARSATEVVFHVEPAPRKGRVVTR